MLVTASLVLNKIIRWFDFKKVVIITCEIIFFLVAILKEDFSWLFSFNLALTWYLVIFFFWSIWLSKVLSFGRGRWPLLIIFGIIKLAFYTLPFFITWAGEQYFPNTLFETEASIFGILISFWIVLIDQLRSWEVFFPSTKNN